MASVTLLLKENKANSKGELPLYIRIIKGRKAKFISLGIRVHPDLWNAEKLRVKAQFKNSGRINAFIAKKVADAEAIAVTLETNENYVSSKKIKETIKGREPISFIKYMEQYIADLKAKGKIGTYDKANSTLLKLKTYLNNKDLSFDEFDLAFLKRYDAYLRDVAGNSPNTIHGNLKMFRKLFNDAIREDLIETTPFSKFKLTWQKTQKEFLTENELERLEKVSLERGTMMYHHRNMFVFAAYVEAPIKLTTSGRGKLTTCFAGEDLVVRVCQG